MDSLLKKIIYAYSKRKLKKKLVSELEDMYQINHAPSKEIDAYNYGIRDSIKKVNEILK